MKKWWEKLKCWWAKYKKFLIPLGLFLLPYLGMWFVFGVFGSYENEKVTDLHCKEAFFKAIGAPWVSIVSFVLTLWAALHQFSKENVKKQTELVKDLKTQIDSSLTRSKIVFESGINEFDDKHLLAFHRVLNALDEKIKKDNIKEHINLYFIDNSDPRSWWSDTMTGFLALLAKWSSNQNGTKTIHRVFVCQKNELLSPIFAKTISLHSLMGFKTYVIVYEKYKEIVDEILKEHKTELDKLPQEKTKYLQQEIVIWSKEETTTESKTQNIVDLDLHLNGLSNSKQWQQVRCYQSFWEVGSDFNKRISLQEKSDGLKEQKKKGKTIIAGDEEKISNFYGHETDLSVINIWYDFISKEKNDDTNVPDKAKAWEELPKAYLDLLSELIKKMICCKDQNEVWHIKKNDLFGIEFKTKHCPSLNLCSHHITCLNQTDSMFDFVSMEDIKRILNAYYVQLNK